MSKITLENISYVYSPGTPFEMHALTDINLNIRENAITGLIGHTGSGKSTLAKLLSSVLEVQEGSIVIDGIDLSKIETEEELMAVPKVRIHKKHMPVLKHIISILGILKNIPFLSAVFPQYPTRVKFLHLEYIINLL